MNINEFQPYEEPTDDYGKLISDFRNMGIRCIVKHYTDREQLRLDSKKLYYRANTRGNIGWLSISRKGLDLYLINTEVEA